MFSTAEHIYIVHFDGSVQNCGISFANTLEIPQSCVKPLINEWTKPSKDDYIFLYNLCFMINNKSFLNPSLTQILQRSHLSILTRARRSIWACFYVGQARIRPMRDVNSLWPSDAIRQQRSGSTLAQVMACCRQRSSVTFILGHFHKRCLNHQSLKSVWNFFQTSQGPMS